ncbi:LacI family DNA-binding transcriptional regulator [Streptomyces spinoverrucosus]|uniref:LacI family DNA-binding transcriptional regulator n=1 Tax=Streptomyces spinoverrucosus TaxID=284043 RepID=UPI0018C3AD38|nr:LacI family DNA-binding transcriptional regulator [Streptomyces spinoverrucosus]MBG0851387.1 LacI family DNA-binding transcriptional regulator [Streptomyces spinoverrucosus]
MVTRQDVAQRAGVSPSVVIYVLNHGPRTVAPTTRDRVLAAVRDLGYRPKSAARALRFDRIMTLGLVLPDCTNPYFTELAASLENHAWSAGYTLLVGNSAAAPERESGHIRALLDRQVDGLLLAPAHRTQPWYASLARTGLPVVAIDREVSSRSMTHVLVDNERGAREATEHLLAHGRRRIGCLAGPPGFNPSRDRVVGWRQALEAAGLKAGSGSGGRTGWQARPAAAPLLHGVFDRGDAYRSSRALLAHDRNVDGLFVTSDEQAKGVLHAANELGIHVPDDLTVITFDGSVDSAYTNPPLSTMRQPIEHLGRTAIGRLLDRMNDPDLPPSRDVLAAQLITRASCGC